MKDQEKTKARHEYHGFGFKVVFYNAKFRKRLGHWCLEVDWNEVRKQIALAIARKPSRLTGAEVKFIRQNAHMTLKSFGERFSVTHPAVLKWERAGDKPTGMAWATEKDIRLAVLDWSKCPPRDFKRAYEQLETPVKSRHRVFKYDAATGSLAA